MSLDRCLPDLERKGQLDVGRSKEARELYDELRRFYERSHDPETAAALASQKTIERLEAAAARKKANLIRQIKAQERAIATVREFDGGDPDASGPLDPRGALAIFGFDGRAGHNNSVEGRWKAIKGRAHGYISEILYKHHENLLGNLRNKADLDALVDEAFEPGSTGNASARELADSFSKAAEYLRARRNDAGGDIGKIDNWFPQSHSARKIRDAGYVAWREFATGSENPLGRPLFDRAKMIDRRTGEPFTDAAFEPFLRDIWETLRTDGWSKATPGAAGGKMLANQRADHRIIHFTDGAAWRAYNEQFGEGNAYMAMMTHIEGMSRDIALMEILGPNPAATVRWLKDTLVKVAQLDVSPGSNAIAKAESYGPKIQGLYDEITGALRRPESERIALTFSTIRAVQTGAKLGSAILSALPTDPAFGAVTRAFNGMPTWKMFGSYAKQLNPLSAEDRKFAVRAGLIAEEWAHMTAASSRFLQEEMTGEVARRLSSGVLRVSGLSWFTQAGRWAFGMDLLGHVTDQVHLKFDELGGRFRAALERHGITAADWEVIRNSPIEEHKGVGWILPKNVEDQAPGGAADKLLQMIHTEVDFAVPMPDLRTRAFVNRHVKRGTIPGELIKSAFLFKGFGIGVVLTHGARIIQQAPATATGYFVGAFILTTLGGAVSLELKELAKGKDPRPVPRPYQDPPLDNLEFWGASALQGGGWGIFGDFLGSSQNRFGGGFGSTLAGPQAQSIQNVAQLGFSSGRAALGDKKANPGRDLVRVIKQETPGSSLWFSRVAFERLVADQLQEEIDPDYRKSWRAVQRRARQTKQDYWWEPGETSPERAPKVEKK